MFDTSKLILLTGINYDDPRRTRKTYVLKESVVAVKEGTHEDDGGSFVYCIGLTHPQHVRETPDEIWSKVLHNTTETIDTKYTYVYDKDSDSVKKLPE